MAFENLKKAYSLDEGDRVLLAEITTNYYYSKRYNEAIEMFKLKKEKGWEDKTDPIMIARSYYYMEDYAGAEKAFADLIAVDPKNIDAYLWKARAVSKLDPDLEEGLAAPHFEELVNAIGTETEKYKGPLQEAYSYFGYFKITKKDYDAAKEWYDKMYSLDPNNKEWQISALTAFASIAYKEKDYVEARDNYQKILALQPNNPTIEQAIKDLNKVIQAGQK
jgi:tetratricopeptide (TPR) repeat protein